MIWYDNTPSQMVHKVYNPGLSQWVVLDQNMISSITYSELVNIATNVGLTVGQWFKITDKSNAIALAVTSTKVQYSDSLGNILIDDLGSNIQYHVSSSNLSIDDVVGVFDEVNKKLVFQFSEQVPDYTADDYILGKVKRNNVRSLAKFKLSSFLSSVTGNSITWNGGFFFNFSRAISAILDKKGGVVSKDTYDIDKQNIATDIQNVGKENQTIIENANTAISNATSTTAIYDKQTPAVETGGEPTDVATGDKLITIVSKFQRYINKFKFATGIKISKNFNTSSSKQFVNSNDTVESAVSKIQWWIINKLNNESSGTILNESFSPAENDITPGETNLTEVLERVFFDLSSFSEINFRKRYDKVIDNVNDLIKIGTFTAQSSFLIKKGIYNITSVDSNIIDVSSIISGNKIVEFEADVVINIFNNTDSDQNVFFGTESTTDNIGYHSKGHWNGNGAIINVSGGKRTMVFKRVYNLIGFIINSVENGFTIPAKPMFYHCCGLSMCVNNSATSSFMNCLLVSSCKGRFINCEFLKDCYGNFADCVQCFQCRGTKSGISKNVMIDGTAFSNSAAGGFNQLTS